MLGSGSRGNAVLLETDGSRVLVDAGFPPRVLAQRLARVGVAPASIGAVVLTHEHTDHVRGVAAAATRWGWAIHATRGTIAGCADLVGRGVRILEPGVTSPLGEFDVVAVRAPHDAAEPVALVLTARQSGARAGIAYDLGHVTDGVRQAMRDLDLLVLEANHDPAMLRSGPYPPVVQDRIAGRHGHLANPDAAALAREVSHRGLSDVILAHLSQQCNRPALALGAVGEGLRRARFRGRLTASSQDDVAGPFGAPVRTAVQLPLGL
jgi:phosphoribosyl 1,2-cyclic phosphodiesterase